MAFAKATEHRFSFSGLKTSLRYTLEKLDEKAFEAVKADLCASYEEAVIRALNRKVGQFVDAGGWASIGLSGGVANNRRLREAIRMTGEVAGLPVHIAEPHHTGDNAAMIAFAAYLDPAGMKEEAGTFDPAWELA